MQDHDSTFPPTRGLFLRNSLHSLPLVICLIAVFVLAPGPTLVAQEPLDEPVPWSGTIRRTTVKELIARITGWAEGEGHPDFHFAEELEKDLTEKKIKSLTISDQPRPSYREVLENVFWRAGESVALSQTDQGIAIIDILQFSFTLPARVREYLKRTDQWDLDSIKKIMRKKDILLSKHAEMNFLRKEGKLILRGTKCDGDKVARFLGR